MLLQGDQPHAGFPEANYLTHAERLARAGHRVVVVEQTETPDQLKARNERLKAQGKKIESVVRRECVAVLTKGTLYEPEMLAASPDASFLLAIYERALEAAEREGAPEVVELACCACDVATGQLLLGQWRDDELRSRLRAQLAAVQPVEVVHTGTGLPGELSETTRRVLRGALAGPRREPRTGLLSSCHMHLILRPPSCPPTPSGQATTAARAGTTWSILGAPSR